MRSIIKYALLAALLAVVAGLLGGYNIHWALASGALVARSIA